MTSVAARVRYLQIIVILAVATLLAAGCSDAGTSPVLQPSADHPTEVGDARTQFTFRYEATGTNVLDCVLPNRSFGGAVFDDGTYTLTTDEGWKILHLDATTYLSPELFGAPTPEQWVEVPDDRIEAVTPKLDLALGVDLSSHVGRRSPPDGNAIVHDALSQGASVEPLGPDPAVDGWRLRVPPARDVGTPILLDLWIDGEDVARLVVRRPGSSDTPDPHTGWIVDYAPLPASINLPVAPTPSSSWTEGVRLRPRLQQGCDLEVFDEEPPLP